MTTNPRASDTSSLIQRLLALLLKVPWLEVAAELWRLVGHRWRGLSSEGMYEVLDYTTRLELLDAGGRRARVTKRETVRYLQNNILAYQDQGWSDGETFLDYRCAPGVVVDRYRPAHKTYLLISLRGARQKGDEDLFRIEYAIRDGFRRERELWEVEISHRTRRLTLEILFPAERGPRAAWLMEHNRRSRRAFPLDETQRLSDGRRLLTWRVESPRLYERYQLGWEW